MPGQRFATWKVLAAAWVAVITGVGPDFCTGADLKKFIPELTGELPKPEGVEQGRRHPRRLAPVPGVQADCRALTMGLINRVVPADELLDTAYDYAARIAANAPLAVFATKQSAVEGLALDLESAYDNETRHSDRVFDDRECLRQTSEGPRAFAEKRPPRWQAR